MAKRKIAAIAVLILAPLSYFAVTALFLSRATLQLYGFPVMPDVESAIEIALQACPMLAALIMILASGFREQGLRRVGALLPVGGGWAQTAALLVVNGSIALLTTGMTAAAIVSVCGLQRGGVRTATLLWVAFEFTLDLTLVAIFTTFVHALIRKVWASFLLFVVYATLVVVFGTKWGVTSFIGFASTVPISLTSYSKWPLYDDAGWLFRAYWIAVTVVLVMLLHRYSRPPQSLSVTMYEQWSLPQLKRARAELIVGCTVCLGFACGLLQVQQYALAKYRGPSPRRLDAMLSAAPGQGRLRITHYDLQMNYEPDKQMVRVSGAVALQSPESALKVGYLQLPVALALDHLELQDAGGYRLTSLGKYVRIDWSTPLLPGRSIKLVYTGVIHPAGPFDLTLQAKLLREAFFFTDADILAEPRQLPCILSNPTRQTVSAGACENENYTLSDMATGTIRVIAPDGFVAVGPGERAAGSEARLNLDVAKPEATTFMVACARFTETSSVPADGLPIIHVYREGLDGRAQAQTAKSTISYYQTKWPPYPLPELHIVETPTQIGEAVAFDGVLSISDRIVRSRNRLAAGTSDLTQLVFAHEISHQWWGYQVVPARSPGRLFVLESFAQFAAYKYLESRGVLTEDAAIDTEKRNYELTRAHAANAEAALATLNQNDLPLAYHKGPLVLLSLDKLVGGSLMDDFGRLIVASRSDGSRPARPDQIVRTLVDGLPAQSQAAARSMLFATSTPPDPRIESAKLARGPQR